MPHSSGGGSHSGGSHGGSGGSFGGGGSKGPRISRTYYPGARRYRYYGRNGREQYIYSKERPRPQSIVSFIITMLFFIPFILAGSSLITPATNMVIPPKPLKPVYSSTDVHIQDEYSIIDHTEDLEKSMKEFEKLTGICPYIITVQDSEWKNGNYSNLEDYAYNLYINHFGDEQHLLVVYSEPDNAKDMDYVNWSWECMQGDDTDPILTEYNMQLFNDDVYKYLCNDSMSVEQAFKQTFDNSLSYVMTRDFDFNRAITPCMFPILWYGFLIFAFITNAKSFIQSRRNYEEVPDSFSYNQNNYNNQNNYMDPINYPDLNNPNNTYNQNNYNPNNTYDSNNTSDPNNAYDANNRTNLNNWYEANDSFRR